jgi:hypothetical protein
MFLRIALVAASSIVGAVAHHLGLFIVVTQLLNWILPHFTAREAYAAEVAHPVARIVAGLLLLGGLAMIAWLVVVPWLAKQISQTPATQGSHPVIDMIAAAAKHPLATLEQKLALVRAILAAPTPPAPPPAAPPADPAKA